MAQQRTLKKSLGTSNAKLDDAGMFVIPGDVQKITIAKGMVSHDVVIRTNEQTINFPVLLYSIFFLLVLPWWWVRAVSNRNQEAIEKRNIRLTAIASDRIGTPTPGQGVDTMPLNITINIPTQQPQATYTPYPTFTPSVDWLRGSPTVTPNSFLPGQVNWVFSYYYPDLVGVDEQKYGANCHPDNIERNPQGKAIRCKNTSASGLPWRDWIMYKSLDVDFVGGVAVPYYPGTYNPIYPMGAVVVVESPSIIAGRYLVIDICPACDDYVTSNNVLFLDFVAEGLPQGITFWDDVEISSVIYP